MSYTRVMLDMPLSNRETAILGFTYKMYTEGCSLEPVPWLTGFSVVVSSTPSYRGDALLASKSLDPAIVAVVSDWEYRRLHGLSRSKNNEAVACGALCRLFKTQQGRVDSFKPPRTRPNSRLRSDVFSR